MQIERIETFPLLHKISKPYGDANGYKKYRSCYLIRIITTSGLDGWGECVDWLPTIHMGFNERIIPFLIGKQASDRLALVETIKKWHGRAAAAVSMALTEIIAKSANISICDLWGGTFQKSIPVYASFQSYSESNDWIRESIDFVEDTIMKGYSKIKIKIGGKKFAEDLAHVKLIQKLDAEKMQLILDANQSYDMATARLWNRYFSNWSNVLWFEEPLPVDNPVEYQILRSSLSVPIAGGENIISAKKFLPLLRQNALDIIQPDIMHVGGIDQFRETLQLARHFGIRVSPHSYDGVLSRLYSLFGQASLPPWSKMEGEDIEPVEWDVMENPFSGLISIKPSNGRVDIPNGAGIGAELDLDLIKGYLWDGSSYQS
ncbi:mandelate racemase/muconate lactonizing enzyme family protein [Bacillus sp. V59.32b]|uniref:mandelate racemase/muconate lactonizing enzyme family protein n=1 Tax=Bacillus sp. V59.32b TaxID=1758642 RepID=UPI000E3C7F9D|nr:mandelate racemase/muconate lactonizing enzyme family protein [Bacillus sp. V59.32b]RFU66110.1 mandelate racemase/muconate lactonizing enzyme family protein [Bacillus sp. V59.32b]